MTLHLHTLPLPTAQEMRRWDGETVALGIPECMLMENAARAALQVLQKLQFVQDKHILLFMGPGNNGGDAACLARHLLDLGALPLVAHTKSLDSYDGVTQEHIAMAKACAVPFIFIGQETWQENIPEAWKHASIIVDGLLGTGFEGDLRPLFASYISYINAQRERSFIFALDIPSGCHALRIYADTQAVQAHATVCFAAAKPAQVLPQAQSFMGELFIRSIGIPRQIQETYAPSYRLLQEQYIGKLLQENRPQSHKGQWGHVLVLAGSQGLTGAAHLTALAALRSGAGLVTVAAPQALCAEIKAHNPNIMTLALGDGSYKNDQQDCWPHVLPSALTEKMAQVDALAVGPGMGMGESALAFLFALLKHKKRPRAIFDADALTLLAGHKELLPYLTSHDILTPHPGEAARFLEGTSTMVQADRCDAITSLCHLAPCVWLLKGAGTRIKQGDGPMYILPHDLPSLAVAGSGDVLAGCMGACAARFSTYESITVTALAASIHATAGKLALHQYPQRGHMASDLAHLLPVALQEISAQALPLTYPQEVSRFG